MEGVVKTEGLPIYGKDITASQIERWLKIAIIAAFVVGRVRPSISESRVSVERLFSET